MNMGLEKMPEEYKGKTTSENNITTTIPRKWTKEELEWCVEKKEMGYSVKEIAEATDRSEVSISIKLKRAKKKDNTYNVSHVEEKYKINKEFFEEVKPKNILDVYCGVNSFWKNNFKIPVVTNDLEETFEADYHMDALKFMCLMYSQGNKFDLIDLDPFGSASECFDLAIKMAKKGLVITLGEMGHKRWNRLDYVSRHYNINNLDDFNSKNIIEKIIEQGKKHKKLLVPYIHKDWQNISRVWFKIKPYKIQVWDEKEKN